MQNRKYKDTNIRRNECEKKTDKDTEIRKNNNIQINRNEDIQR